jgi:formate hydrogenlyase subunit 3/multisubunit Na+/H+ antiporter MnhD subunit
VSQRLELALALTLTLAPALALALTLKKVRQRLTQPLALALALTLTLALAMTPKKTVSSRGSGQSSCSPYIFEFDCVSHVFRILAAVVCYCFVKVSSNKEALQQSFYETASYC